MPHVVIEQALDLATAIKGVQPTVLRNGTEILKLVDVFLNRSGRTALVDCVAVENGQPQSFFVQVTQKDEQFTVRLLPATDPEKTDGVKQLMARIAHQLHAAADGSSFGKTNLQDFLD